MLTNSAIWEMISIAWELSLTCREIFPKFRFIYLIIRVILQIGRDQSLNGRVLNSINHDPITINLENILFSLDIFSDFHYNY